jgi:hypothetical protein
MVALVVLLANLVVAATTLTMGVRTNKAGLSHQTKLAKLREEHEAKMTELTQGHAKAMQSEQQKHERQMKAADQAHEQQLEQAKSKSAIEAEERRRLVEVRAGILKESVELQVKRLRDIRRACHQTLRDVVELKDLSPSLHRNEMLVRSGSILRKSAIILAPADDKIPDLPDPCYAPLAKVRDALVKVILSWSAERDDRQPGSRLHEEMVSAIREMQGAVEIFIPAAQNEEHQVLISIAAPPVA